MGRWFCFGKKDFCDDIENCFSYKFANWEGSANEDEISLALSKIFGEDYNLDRLKEFGITKQNLAELLDVSGGTVGNRFRNPGEWKMCEVYAVCDLLNISPLDICEYFPRERKQ